MTQFLVGLFLCNAPCNAFFFLYIQSPQSPQSSVEPSKGSSTLETYLYQAKLSDGETALKLELDKQPQDDNIRFSLGVIQFFRAIENLGQALYEYGALSNRLNEPILRLGVPQNENPSELSPDEFGRVLDTFRHDLIVAEQTLAGVHDDRVKISIKLARVALRISPETDEKITLNNWMQEIRIDVTKFAIRNPELEVHFDRGDVPWIRAYCHALCALVELYRSIDENVGFEQRFKGVFPKLKPSESKPKTDKEWIFMLSVKDPSRLRLMREHLIAVCQLNHESWKHIRLETDDDFEWLSHPGQTDQLGMPVTNQQIDAWLGMMDQIEGLLTGERLIDGSILVFLNPKYDSKDGLNLRKVLDNPPRDLLNFSRIQTEGFDPQYIEVNSNKPKFDMAAILTVFRLFSGPFGMVQAARMN
ncbi:MAG: hypothetical protein ACK5PB_21070 [Pirellula sp.]